MGQEIKQTNSGDTNTNTQPQKTHTQSASVYRPKRWVAVLFVVALITVGAVGVWFILWASRAFNDPTAALTFIMGSIISLFLLLSTIATTCIYWGQRNIMLKQWSEMHESVTRTDLVIDKMQGQLTVMRETLEHERIRALEDARDRIKQFEIMDRQALISDTQMKIAAEAAKITERQLEAMKQQAEIMLRQFEVTDRAWLAFEAIPIKPITFNEQGMNVSFQVIAKNVGRSVAINATINLSVIVPPLRQKIETGVFNLWEYVLTKQREVCDRIDSDFMSYAIFPNEIFGHQHSFGLGPQDLEKGHFPEAAFVLPYLVGCVDYKLPGHETHHQTRFIYELLVTNESGQLVSVKIGEEVPVQRIVLRKAIIGGGDYAD